MVEKYQLLEDLSMNVISVGKNTVFMIKKLDFVTIAAITLFLKLPIALMRKVIWFCTERKDGNQI